MSGDKLAYNYIRKYDEDVVEIVYDSSVPKMLTDDVLRLLTEGLGDAIYALDDTPLEKRLVQLLKLRGRKICVAESFHGPAAFLGASYPCPAPARCTSKD